MGVAGQPRTNHTEFCLYWILNSDVRSIERVQRTALSIIRGEYHKYSESLDYFSIASLASRREKLCLNFALKAYQNEKFKSWFCPANIEHNTRSIKLPLTEIKTRTSRFRKSPIPYLTNILNVHLSKGNCDKDREWQRIFDLVEHVVNNPFTAN